MKTCAIALYLAIFPAAAFAITAGWDNINPERKFPVPGRVYWRADFSNWPEGFIVERKDGAEGSVTMEERNGVRGLRIEKTNGRGYITVRPRETLPFPENTELQSFAFVSSASNDPLYAVGFLRLRGERHRSLAYFSKLDGRGPGGPKMQYLANTAPGVRERKLCRYLCSDREGGTNVVPTIVVAGERSESRWEDWGVEDLVAAKESWKEFARRVAPADRSSEMQDEAAFDADLAREPDHVAKVVRRDGLTRLLVDGREVSPILFKGRGARPGKVLYAGKKMAEAGIDIQSLYVRFGRAPEAFGYWTKDGFDAKGAAESVRLSMRTAPGAKFVLSVSLDAYPEYSAEHPDEVWKLMDGKTVYGHQVHASYFLDRPMPKSCWPWISNHSLVWRADVKRNLALLIDELKRTGLSKRIVGVHIAGYHDAQFAPRHVDFSKPAREGFRRWQKGRYGKVLWKDPPDSYSKAEVLRPGADDLWIAYHSFLKRAPFEMQEDLARHVKRCFGKDIILVRYCMSAFGGTYCGAYDISDFLTSDAFDVICAQPSYEMRTPAMPIGTKMPIASFHEHGKLFLNEFDLRTYGGVHGIETELRVLGLSQATDFPMWETINRKVSGEMIAKRMGWWYLDMSGGWFDPPEIARDIASVADTKRAVDRADDGGWRPSAALVIDEDGVLLRNTPNQYYNIDEQMALDAQVDFLAESGVPYDTWLMADVIRNPQLLKGCRTVVFSTLYSIDATRRAALEALKRDGRTLVFLTGAGRSGGADATGFSFDERDPPADHAVVAEKGFDVNMLSGYDTKLLTSHLGMSLGGFWLPRRFEVRDEPGVVPRARFVKGFGIAAAERPFADWRAVSICEPAGLTPQYFNRLVRESGGYVPVDAGVQVHMNGSFMSVHCIIPGRYRFVLPFAAKVTNLKSGREETAVGGAVTLDLVAGETCWFRLERL